ncbi:STAS domain-containing protein [Blastococcus litoris]|uniref:STAS domain-containing protein n=1 Tax=Blastococcus litoris TaxID=2171622 RepID=UPI000E302A8A|nr:STAS domain-containing protein [Blastococcus litoris]
MEQPEDDEESRTRPAPGPEAAAAFSQVVDTRVGTIRAEGDLTGASAHQLRGTVDALRGAGRPGVVLDLRGIGSVDEDGLSSVEAIRAAVEADGGRLTLLVPDGQASGPRPAPSAG